MTNALNILKQHYRFEEWAGRNRLPEDILVLDHELPARECPGWELRFVDLIDPAWLTDETPPGGAAGMEQPIMPILQNTVRERPYDPVLDQQRARVVGVPWSTAQPNMWMPRLTRSFWKPRQVQGDIFVNLNLYELASRRAAHDFLLRLLGDFQCLLVRRPDQDLGDVAFGGPSDTAVVFARANHVCLVRSAASENISAIPLARWIDKALVARPENASNLRVQVPRKMTEVDEGASMELPLSVPRTRAAPDERRTIKIFAPGGTLYRSNDRVFFQPGTFGELSVEIFDVSRYSPPTRKTLRLQVHSSGGRDKGE